MATIAKLMVELGLEDSAFQRGLESSRKKLDAWGSSLRSTGTMMTAAVTTPIVGAGTAMINWASDLDESINKSNELFGSNSAAVVAWSSTSSKTMGMSQQAALDYNSSFAGMLKTVASGPDELVEMSGAMTQLTADFASFHNLSPEEAFTVLSSAMAGETEAIRRYGVDISAAAVEQKAMEMGLASTTGELTEQDKALARYQIIMDETTSAQGDFERTSDSTSNRLKTMRARIQDVGAKFGSILLPYVNKAVDGISRFVDWLDKLDGGQKKVVIALLAFAAALGPILLVVGMLLPGIGALVAVIGFLVSPVGLVVLAVAALAAGLIYAYTHFEGFREVVDRVASAIKGGALAAIDALVAAFGKLKAAFDVGGFSGMMSTLGDMLMNGLSQLSNLAYAGMQWLADAFINGVAALSSAGYTWLQGLADGAMSKWGEFTGWLAGLVADAVTWIGDTTQSLWQKGVDLFVGLGNGITTQWANLQTWLAGVAGYVVSAVGDLIATLWQKGVDLFVGLGNGITAQWGNLQTWVKGLAGYVTSAVGNVLSTLWQKGVDLFVGLGNGVTAQWAALKLWLSGIGGKVASAVGSLASSLWNAGWDIINGLWDGMKNRWNDITGWLSSLDVADFKGPEQRDKKMLYKPGLWIMDGLSNGLGDGWDDVARQLSGYMPTIAGSGSAGMAGSNAGAPVVQIITLEPGKWAEFLADAQAGGSFARSFAPELAMMEG